MHFIPMIIPPPIKACQMLLLRLLTKDPIEDICQYTYSNFLKQRVFTFSYTQTPWRFTKDARRDFITELKTDQEQSLTPDIIKAHIEKYCKRHITLYLIDPTTQKALTLQEITAFRETLGIHTTQVLCGIASMFVYSKTYQVGFPIEDIVRYTHLQKQRRINRHVRIAICQQDIEFFRTIYAHISWKTSTTSIQWTKISPIFVCSPNNAEYRLNLEWGEQFKGSKGNLQFKPFPDVFTLFNDKRNFYAWKLLIFFVLCQRQKEINIYELFVNLFGQKQIEHAHKTTNIRSRLFEYFYKALRYLQDNILQVTYTFSDPVFMHGFEKLKYQKTSWVRLQQTTLSVKNIDKNEVS